MFLRTYHPSPILLELGPLTIHWYGLLIVVAIVLGIFLVVSSAKKHGIKAEKVIDLSFYLIISGLLGARIYYILLYPKYFLSHPLNVLKIWQGGLGIFGAIIFGLAILFFYAKKQRLSFLLLLDLTAPALILGQAIGRWGNYFNSELYGWSTNLPWGIPIVKSDFPGKSDFHHPCFLYEFFWDLGVFLILLMFSRKKPLPHACLSATQGQVCSLYLILYSLGRFFIEFIRIDFSPIILGLRIGQCFSLVFFTLGLVLFFRLRSCPDGRARATAQIS